MSEEDRRRDEVELWEVFQARKEDLNAQYHDQMDQLWAWYWDARKELDKKHADAGQG